MQNIMTISSGKGATMYRLEHINKTRGNTLFITVSDEHQAFAVGDTSCCAWNVGTEHTVTTHATIAELAKLSNTLMVQGYRQYDAGDIAVMEQFKSLIQGA